MIMTEKQRNAPAHANKDTWLEQRGKRISPIISGDYMLLHSPKRNIE